MDLVEGVEAVQHQALIGRQGVAQVLNVAGDDGGLEGVGQCCIIQAIRDGADFLEGAHLVEVGVHGHCSATVSMNPCSTLVEVGYLQKARNFEIWRVVVFDQRFEVTNKVPVIWSSAATGVWYETRIRYCPLTRW